MADKLGLGTGVHELKIGQSFFNAAAANPAGRGRGGPPGGRGRPGPQAAQTALPSYHTIRYDFKPASSSTSSKGFLKVDPETQGVKVTVPHENGDSQTNFSGHQKKANEKECILVIDRVTGEITLEKLSSQILVKKTRAEKPERANNQQNFIQQRQQQKQQQLSSSSAAPTAPAQGSMPSFGSPPAPGSMPLFGGGGPTLPPTHQGNDKTAGKHRVGTSRPINPMERSQSPAGGGPGRPSKPSPHQAEPMQPPPPTHVTHTSQQKQKQQATQSHSQQPQSAPAMPQQAQPALHQKMSQVQQVAIASKYVSEELSSGSSGTDSSSSDSGSDDSDDDDTNEASSKTQSSSTSSMPSFGGAGPGSMPSFGGAGPSSTHSSNSAASMPDFLMGGGGAPGCGASAEQAPLTDRQPNRHGINQQVSSARSLASSKGTFQTSNGGTGINGRPKSASSGQPQLAAAPNPTMSMPQILGNDLQLSESDSD